MIPDKIKVNMNVYDIPILVEALEEANKETERLHSIIKEAIEYIELWHYRNDYRVNSFTTECKNDLLEILKVGDK